ncbi:hypothetical protein ECDEC11D_2999 [Escherichia coli DEC11D]|nr:hypothetical protein ECDEC11D_2999 [Escherichia coli DEC11D]
MLCCELSLFDVVINYALFIKRKVTDNMKKPKDNAIPSKR